MGCSSFIPEGVNFTADFAVEHGGLATVGNVSEVSGCLQGVELRSLRSCPGDLNNWHNPRSAKKCRNVSSHKLPMTKHRCLPARFACFGNQVPNLARAIRKWRPGLEMRSSACALILP